MRRRRYPDLIAILPEVGVLVIEVKDWWLAELVSVNADTVTITRRPSGRQRRLDAKRATRRETSALANRTRSERKEGRKNIYFLGAPPRPVEPAHFPAAAGRRSTLVPGPFARG